MAGAHRITIDEGVRKGLREEHPDVRLSLQYANLNDVNLANANLEGADLTCTRLAGAVLPQACHQLGPRIRDPLDPPTGRAPDCR